MEPITLAPPTTAAPAPALVRARDDAYDTARLAWDLAAAQRPSAICVATTVAEVQAALALARDEGLRVAAQTTGHFAGALPDLGGTLLLKLALHDGDVEVDPVARRVRVPAGAVWDDVVSACAPHGLTALHGSSPTVGVIGYLLGGGLSFYAREHGLAANHVTAIEVVTADGTHRRVDADHGADLFWALRGGGGGFAVVTAVEIEVLDRAESFAGALFWPVAHARPLLDAWRAWTRDAPRSVTTSWRVLQLPPIEDVPPPLRGVPVVCVDGVALEDADGEELVRRLTAVAEPLLGGWERMPAPAIARLHGDPEDPTPGIGDGLLVEDLDDAAVEAFLGAVGEGSGSPLVIAELRQTGGALAQAPAGAGVRGSLEGRFVFWGVGMAMDDAAAGAIRSTLDRALDALAPSATGTWFTSFTVSHTGLEGCVPDAALPRLAAIRAVYDPDALLVAAHTVAPAAG